LQVQSAVRERLVRRVTVVQLVRLDQKVGVVNRARLVLVVTVELLGRQDASEARALLAGLEPLDTPARLA